MSGGADERRTGRPSDPGIPEESPAAGHSASAAERPDAAEPEDIVRSSARPLLHSEVLAWLDARESPPPADLRARIERALAGAKAETVPGILAEGALSCLQETVAAPQERATALDLLAADALLTYALEAAAELGASTLREIVDLYGPEALASVLPLEGAAPAAPAAGAQPPSAPGGPPTVAPEAPGTPGSPAPEGG